MVFRSRDFRERYYTKVFLFLFFMKRGVRLDLYFILLFSCLVIYTDPE